MRCPAEGCQEPTALGPDGRPLDPHLFRCAKHLSWKVVVHNTPLPGGEYSQQIVLIPPEQGWPTQ